MDPLVALTSEDIALRTLAAFGAGMLLGWERESRGRPAGLRTTILTCVASAVAMMISEALFIQAAAAPGAGSWRPDPARLGAGILTGIGFLGAGTIIRHENFIRGVTTAATLWFSTVLGLAIGSGEFLVAGPAMVVALVTLFLLPPLEKHIQADHYSSLTLAGDMEQLDETILRKRLENAGVTVLKFTVDYDCPQRHKTVVYDLRLKRPDRFEKSAQILRDFAALPGVSRVKWD